MSKVQLKPSDQAIIRLFTDREHDIYNAGFKDAKERSKTIFKFVPDNKPIHNEEVYDVIIDKNYRGNGLGKWFFKNIIEHPDLVDTKIYLTTRDAHGLYKKYGFETMVFYRENLPVKNHGFKTMIFYRDFWRGS